MAKRPNTAESRMSRTVDLLFGLVIGVLVVAMGTFGVFAYHAWRFFNG